LQEKLSYLLQLF